MHQALRHIHKRKHPKLLKYPHPDPKIRFLDNTVLIFSAALPLMSLPQAYTIWILKNTEGVSLMTWLAFTVLAIPFIFYGFVHKVKPMIVTNILWVLISASILIGLLVIN